MMLHSTLPALLSRDFPRRVEFIIQSKHVKSGVKNQNGMKFNANNQNCWLLSKKFGGLFTVLVTFWLGDRDTTT
jgi:hypothetical protein